MKRLLVIILTTALFASGGYFAWQQTHKDTSKSSPPPPTQSQPSPPTSDPSEGGKYLVIKEWGVRFKLDKELVGDIDYAINENKVIFSSAKLSAIADSNCQFRKAGDGVSTIGGIGVTLLRTAEKITENYAAYSEVNILKSGEFWYHTLPAKGSCLKDDTYRQMEGDIEVALINSINSQLSTSR